MALLMSFHHPDLTRAGNMGEGAHTVVGASRTISMGLHDMLMGLCLIGMSSIIMKGLWELLA